MSDCFAGWDVADVCVAATLNAGDGWSLTALQWVLVLWDRSAGGGVTDVGAEVVAEREAPGALFAAETALGAEGTVNDLTLREDCLIISRTAVRAGVVRNMVAVVCVWRGLGVRRRGRKFLEQHEGVGLRLEDASWQMESSCLQSVGEAALCRCKYSEVQWCCYVELGLPCGYE